MKLVRISVFAAAAIIALSLLPGTAQARRHNDEKPAKASQYPNATRKQPQLDLKDKGVVKNLQKGIDAAQKGDAVEADQLLSPIADGRSRGHSKYAQALAQQALATMKYSAGDHAAGITLLKAALANGVMPNDTYYQLMYELAQFYIGDEQYEKSLATLQQWRKEGKRETAVSYAMEGNIQYRLEHYPEAITALKKAKSMATKPEPQWDSLLAASYSATGQTNAALPVAQAALAKNPQDATAMRNVGVLLMQGEKYPQAEKIYADGITSGVLKESADYQNLARIYLLIAQNQDEPKANVDKAIKTLEDGLAKGVLKPGLDVYQLEGDAASIAFESKAALKYYAKAAPFAKDGEIALRQARMYMNLEKYASAVSSGQAAIKKGVKHPGKAYLIIGAAEESRKHRSAAAVALKKAAEYPQSKRQANEWLKKIHE